MAVQDIFKSNVIAVLGIGIVAAVLVPIALPVVARAAKPFTKALVKSGIIVYEKGREAVAELGEVMEDVIAEAKAEIEQEHVAQAVVPAQAMVPVANVAAKPGTETST